MILFFLGTRRSCQVAILLDDSSCQLWLTPNKFGRQQRRDLDPCPLTVLSEMEGLFSRSWWPVTTIQRQGIWSYGRRSNSLPFSLYGDYVYVPSTIESRVISRVLGLLTSRMFYLEYLGSTMRQWSPDFVRLYFLSDVRFWLFLGLIYVILH